MTADATPNVLDLRDVVKVHGEGATAVRALDGVTLDVGRGEFVALCGPSGSGKSTLLHVAGGLDRVSGGTVRVCGQDLASLSRTDLARVRRHQVGYVFQRYNLVPSLTALENVMLPLDFDGTPVRRARRAAHDALERVGLRPPYDRFPDDLAGGEQQRVALARAIACVHAVILADEPTGALDTVNGDLVIELFAELAAEGIAVVMVTHEPRFATYADRVVFFRDGRIVDETSVPLARSGPRAAEPAR